VTAVVEANDVFHLYRAAHADVAALRGLSLDVRERELVSVLGPSGSGKSTLLALCSGFARPSSGDLRVLGREVGQASDRELGRLRRTSIGIVRQHYFLALPRELTVEEIVGLPLRLLGRRDAQRVRELLRAAGLEQRARAKPIELSGGEQQRVAVCAALAKRPKLLLADEPTGELDASATAAVVELMLELVHESGAAALVVTHDPLVAAATERTIHIRDGRLAAEGTERPVLIVDEQGWLRLPRRVREEAGVQERVRAHASWGKVELIAEEPAAHAPTPAPRLDPAEKRATEIALDRVTRRYAGAERAAVDGLTWRFGPEQLHAVGGPSGSGKTTILSLIAGLDFPEEGEVWVGGERVDAMNGTDAAAFRRRMLGYLSQHSTLVEHMTAHENVRLGLDLRGFEEDEAARRATRWLEWVGLDALAGRRADRLSGGERRRVALARALAPSPRVLLADEPTAYLDRVNGRLVVKLLQQAAHEAGTTVVAASHDPDVLNAADTKLDLTPGGAVAPRPDGAARRATPGA
jgi:ABC-type lipoprotein export system ATPase subunit